MIIWPDYTLWVYIGKKQTDRVSATLHSLEGCFNELAAYCGDKEGAPLRYEVYDDKGELVASGTFHN